MKTVNIDGIGDVFFKKSAKAKYIKLKVVPFEGVIVTVPTYLNYEFGIDAVMGRFDWITEQLTNVKLLEDSLQYKMKDFPMETMFYIVNIVNSEIEIPKRKLKGKNVNLYIPLNLNVESSEIQHFISDSLNKVYKAEAKLYLPKRVKMYGEKFNLNVGKITIRNTKTRWGSCSHQNNISLNFHLMKLPVHIIDYVVLHELAHTVEKNHQKGFWDLLDIFCNNKAKELDNELKKFNTLILR